MPISPRIDRSFRPLYRPTATSTVTCPYGNASISQQTRVIVTNQAVSENKTPPMCHQPLICSGRRHLTPKTVTSQSGQQARTKGDPARPLVTDCRLRRKRCRFRAFTTSLAFLFTARIVGWTIAIVVRESALFQTK